MFPVLRFWLIIQLFSLAVLPLAWHWLRPLPGRGYALAKPLGLLLVSYVLWIGASLGFLPNSAGGVLFSLVLVAGVSLWLGRAGLRPASQQDDPNSTGRPLWVWLRAHWRLVLVTEVLFLVAMVGWALLRSYSPDITTAGGEKFMELTFLNGILRSRQFPPQDPWLAGYAISYYYFGYVMLAILTQLSGLAPSVAFNVGLATWFGLTAVASFAVAYDMVSALTARRARRAETVGTGDYRPNDGTGLAGGLLGTLFVLVVSNLAGFLESLQGMGFGSLAFWRWLDVKDLNCLAGPGSTEPIPGCPSASGLMPDRFFWWWRASRVINDRDLAGNAVEVIDEFPFFSFLLGDMHPHVLALPFVLLAVALALAVMLGAGSAMTGSSRQLSEGAEPPGTRATASDGPGAVAWLMRVFPLRGVGFVLIALCLGALGFLNTWDFPIYLFLVTLSVGAGLAWQVGRLNWPVVGAALLAGIGLGLLGGLLFLPFYVGFQSQAGGILPNFIFPTRLPQFFVMFGPVLVPAGLFLLALTGYHNLVRGLASWLVAGGVPVLAFWLLPPLAAVLLTAVLTVILAAFAVSRRRSWLAGLRALLATIWLPILLLTLLLAVGVLTPAGQELIRRVLEMPAVRAEMGEVTLAQLVTAVADLRAGTPWTYLVLAGLVAWVLVLVGQRAGGRSPRAEVRGQQLEVGVRGALNDRGPGEERSEDGDQGVEVLPSTTFALLALLVAFLLAFGVEFVYLRDTFGTRMNTVFKFYFQAWVLMALVAAFAVVYLARFADRRLRAVGLPVIALVAIAGLFYPATATVTRAEGFAREPTLDGTAYLAQQNPGDSAAVTWLRANVPGSATILEAPGGSYRYFGRISAQTGLPTLLGWEGHELQWRGDTAEQDKRRPDIDAIYRGTSAVELSQLLEKWQIDYVVVGPLERSTYQITPQSEARFVQVMDLVFEAEGIRIYRRR